MRTFHTHHHKFSLRRFSSRWRVTFSKRKNGTNECAHEDTQHSMDQIESLDLGVSLCSLKIPGVKNTRVGAKRSKLDLLARCKNPLSHRQPSITDSGDSCCYEHCQSWGGGGGGLTSHVVCCGGADNGLLPYLIGLGTWRCFQSELKDALDFVLRQLGR